MFREWKRSSLFVNSPTNPQFSFLANTCLAHYPFYTKTDSPLSLARQPKSPLVKNQSLGCGGNVRLCIKNDVRNIVSVQIWSPCSGHLWSIKISYFPTSSVPPPAYTLQNHDTQTEQRDIPIQRGLHSRTESGLYHPFTVTLNPIQQMLEGPLFLTGNVLWLYFNSDNTSSPATSTVIGSAFWKDLFCSLFTSTTPEEYIGEHTLSGCTSLSWAFHKPLAHWRIGFQG